MNKGKIIQIMGPVVDVAFPDELPAIKEALEVQLDGKRLVMEVSQHIGNNCVRCIMLATSDGLCKDMEVVATGSSIWRAIWPAQMLPKLPEGTLKATSSSFERVAAK